MLKPFSQTSAGKFLISSSNITKTIDTIVRPRDDLDYAAISEKLRNISRRFNFPLKNLTVDAYSNGAIALLNNREMIRLPTMLPAFTANVNGNFITSVNCTPFVPSNVENLNERQLYAMMQYGTVLNTSARLYNKFAFSNVIQKEGGMVYALMMLKVFDKMIGLSTDEMHRNQLLFFFIKYFNVALLGRTNYDTVTTLADNLTSSTALLIKQNFENSLASAVGAKSQAELYAKPLFEIITSMAETADWLNRMTARGFVQNYLALFQPSALLALERFDYFAAYVVNFASDVGLYSNDVLMSSVVGRSGIAFYTEFIRLTR